MRVLWEVRGLNPEPENHYVNTTKCWYKLAIFMDSSDGREARLECKMDGNLDVGCYGQF